MNDELKWRLWDSSFIVHHSSFIVHHSSFSLCSSLRACWPKRSFGCPPWRRRTSGRRANSCRIPTPPRRFSRRRATATWHPLLLRRPSRTSRRASATACSNSLLFDATWLAPGGANGLGDNDLELQAIFALPCPTINSPLVITPGYGVQYLQGPQHPDLPPQLQDGYVNFRWLSQVTPKLGLDLAITPSIFSDFDQQSSKAFRLPGHAAAAWTWNETTKLVLGAAYLDRFDVEVIPIGGVIWTPDDDTKFDLVFPHPKISRRNYWGGNCGDDVQDWVYIAGEFTGDQWAIRAQRRPRRSGRVERLPDHPRHGAEGHWRREFAFRDRLRFRPPHPLQQRHARLLSHRHRDAPRGIDVLREPNGTWTKRTVGTIDARRPADGTRSVPATFSPASSSTAANCGCWLRRPWSGRRGGPAARRNASRPGPPARCESVPMTIGTPKPFAAAHATSSKSSRDRMGV